MATVILFSGGLDSLAAALMMNGRSLIGVHVQYGQRHAREEAHAAGRLAQAIGLPLRYIDLPRLGLVGDVVPGRNLLFLALAAAVPEAGEVVIGCCAADAAGFPDCRPNFLRAVEVALAEGGRDVSILAPLVGKSKAETFAIIRDAGYIDLAIEVSHTCYVGNHYDRHPWGFGCGECQACLTRAAGWPAPVLG